MHPEDLNERMEPLYVSIRETSRITGLSYVSVYRRVAERKLHAVKAGSKTLVEVVSIKNYLASLPRFVGRTGLSKIA